MAWASSTSPLMTMGTAGGQETRGDAQILPRASDTGMLSAGASMEERMVMARCRGKSRGG